jgi:hypothetical protein
MRLELRWRRERKTKSWRRSGGGRNVMTHTNVFGDGWCKSWPILFFIWKLNKKLPSFFPKWEKFIPDEKRNFFQSETRRLGQNTAGPKNNVKLSERRRKKAVSFCFAWGGCSSLTDREETKTNINDLRKSRSNSLRAFCGAAIV